jgi:curved DNA-binding protein CbpA
VNDVKKAKKQQKEHHNLLHIIRQRKTQKIHSLVFILLLLNKMPFTLEQETVLKRVHSTSNYYEILGTKSSDSKSVIRKAYLSLCLVFHPDKLADQPESDKIRGTSAFQQFSLAYETLSDDTKRSQYDRDQRDITGQQQYRHQPDNVRSDQPFDFFSYFTQNGDNSDNRSEPSNNNSNNPYSNAYSSDYSYSSDTTLSAEEKLNRFYKDMLLYMTAIAEELSSAGSQNSGDTNRSGAPINEQHLQAVTVAIWTAGSDFVSFSTSYLSKASIFQQIAFGVIGVTLFVRNIDNIRSFQWNSVSLQNKLFIVNMLREYFMAKLGRN